MKGSVSIEIQEASRSCEHRIGSKIESNTYSRSSEQGLRGEEEEELDRFEEIDDCLSYLNRLVRDQAAGL